MGGKPMLDCGYRVVLEAEPEEVWPAIERLGGCQGWYYASSLWTARMILDRLLGGVGKRGRRQSPGPLRPGHTLDFWRVLEAAPAERLLLLAEMKAPGEGVMDIRLHRLGPGRTELQLLGRFLPWGLAGLMYWYALYPIHQWVYRGMLRRMAAWLEKTIVQGPDRFAPRRYHLCHVDPRKA